MGPRQLEDPELLDRAAPPRAFTRDIDLWVEATRRQRDGGAASGVVFAHQLQVTIGRCVRDLALIAVAGEPEDLVNQVLFLPLE